MTRITLEKKFFPQKEKLFLSVEGMETSLFQYESGISAVKIKNELGYVIVLPFKGQMIWDVVFLGRRLTMRSPFKVPRNVSFFLDTYGCFAMHCGALRAGCPGPADTHPLHGELPYANYEKAELIVNEDKKGIYVGVTGIYEYNRAFGDHYQAQPFVKVYKNSSLIDISMHIVNLSSHPMELMYMSHINFRPVENGRIVQTVKWSDMELRTSVPQHVRMSEESKKRFTKIKEDPRVTEIIKPEDVYDPEVVFFVHHPKVDNVGFAHYMQIHPDGSADYVGYKPKELDHCSRWIVRTKDHEALGIALPATCDAEGYTAEKKKGNVKILSPRGEFSASIIAGYLSREESSHMEEKIKEIMINGKEG